jgi:hypothetical protein
MSAPVSESASTRVDPLTWRPPQPRGHGAPRASGSALLERRRHRAEGLRRQRQRHAADLEDDHPVRRAERRARHRRVGATDRAVEGGVEVAERGHVRRQHSARRDLLVALLALRRGFEFADGDPGGRARPPTIASRPSVSSTEAGKSMRASSETPKHGATRTPAWNVAAPIPGSVPRPPRWKRANTPGSISSS